MRGAPTHLFNSSMTVTRPTMTEDSGGSPTLTYGDHLSGVKCRVRPVSGNEPFIQSRLQNRITHSIYTEADIDVTEKDRITVNGRTLDVLAIIDFDDSNVYWRLDCEQIVV